MVNINSRLKTTIWLFGLVVVMYATLNLHSRAREFNYHSEIFADKAGYYVFLPSVFLYHFDANAFPDSIEFRTGNGFHLDRIHNKIRTKYPCGVAIMEAPFFLAANVYCIANGTEANGFTRPYHYAIDIAAVCYLLLGFYFLFLFLKDMFDEKSIIISFALFLTGTNLLYYAIQETGLSHIYSFFLFSLFLYLFKRSGYGSSLRAMVPLGICAGLIIMVRPVNILFLPLFFLVDVHSKDELLGRLRQFKQWALLIVTSGVTIIPQLLYYKYQSGEAITYSYGDESFIYKFAPKIAEVLFAFENGWLTNNPIHLFTLAGCLLMIMRKKDNGWLSLALIAVITYVYGSWWAYQLGCGLGHRGFVEFYSLLLIPFTYLVQQLTVSGNKALKISCYVLFACCILINIKLIYTYDGCWYGSSPWDYSQFHHLLFSPTK